MQKFPLRMLSHFRIAEKKNPSGNHDAVGGLSSSQKEGSLRFSDGVISSRRNSSESLESGDFYIVLVFC